MTVREFIEATKDFEDAELEFLDNNLNYQSITLEDIFKDYRENSLKLAPELNTRCK